MDTPKELSFTYGRRFGVEIELNSFDKRDFKKNPLAKGELPKGIEHVAQRLLEVVKGEEVEIRKWQQTHNNEAWVLKPDSSCGMEVCSPPEKGWKGLKGLLKAVSAISEDKQIPVDNRCSLHVHTDISDLSQSQLCSFLAYYVKSEMVFMDSMPPDRKRNRYCQCIGISDVFQVDERISASTLSKKLGAHKYFSFNMYHYQRGSRKTVEFRIVGNEGCLDAFLVKNWVRLLVHFIEMCKRRKAPLQYESGNPWTGLAWLDPEQVFELLGFDGSHPLSSGLEQTRNWFLARLHNNMMSNLPGIWCEEARSISKQSVHNLMDKLNLKKEDLEEYLRPSDQPQALFAEQFRM